MLLIAWDVFHGKCLPTYFTASKVYSSYFINHHKHIRTDFKIHFTGVCRLSGFEVQLCLLP